MKPTDLRGILQYIPQFREKTFVLAIDGSLLPVACSRLRGIGGRFSLSP